jgi:hypothetical protein
MVVLAVRLDFKLDQIRNGIQGFDGAVFAGTQSFEMSKHQNAAMSFKDTMLAVFACSHHQQVITNLFGPFTLEFFIRPEVIQRPVIYENRGLNVCPRNNLHLGSRVATCLNTMSKEIRQNIFISSAGPIRYLIWPAL